jgi:hypothetical protein
LKTGNVEALMFTWTVLFKAWLRKIASNMDASSMGGRREERGDRERKRERERKCLADTITSVVTLHVFIHVVHVHT